MCTRGPAERENVSLERERRYMAQGNLVLRSNTYLGQESIFCSTMADMNAFVSNEEWFRSQQGTGRVKVMELEKEVDLRRSRTRDLC